VKHVRTAVYDLDNSQASRDVVASFVRSGYFDVVERIGSDNEATALLDRGKVSAILHIMHGFADDLRAGRTARLQVLVDGTNSNTASLILSYGGQIIAAYSADAMGRQQNRRVLTRSPGSAVNASAPQVTARSRVWFNPDLYSRNYFVPGVVANIIMMVTLMLTALAIVREKEIGTMEQLMVTPLRPIELMLGKTLPFAAVGLVDVTLVTAVALLVFHVPFNGSFPLMLLCGVLFLMTSLGAGLLLSTISHTQQQAMMSSFFFVMPAFMLSGFAFPIRNMPLVVQYLSYLNPLRYFIEIVRGIFLKGVGVSVLWPQMACLVVYGVTMLTLSALRFHKTLD